MSTTTEAATTPQSAVEATTKKTTTKATSITPRGLERGAGEVLPCPTAEPASAAFVDGEEIDRSVYYKPKGAIPYTEMGISTNETRF